MTTRLRLALLSLVMLSCVGCDQAAKAMARDSLVGRTISLLGGAVRFEYAENTGAFLSLGAELPEALRHFLLIGLAPLALVLVTWLVWRAPGAARAQAAALGLVAGGGLANWIDRVMDDGAVTDYVSLGLGALRTGIFNLADVAIVAGVLLLLRAGRAAGSGRHVADG